MANTGRNDPCPCGSGKKYKKCCLPKEEAVMFEAHARDQAARERRAEARRAEQRRTKAEVLARLAGGIDLVDAEEDELTAASNDAVDLVRAGKLDEAEKAARDLLARFPEVLDGYDRLGMVYEARGDKKQAAYYYRKVIAFVRAHPEQYEPGFEAPFRQLVDELDPPAAT
jgi:tetratricopeptide (TPR) repeat protein